MDKHLTEIEFFEYANNLVEDKTQLARFEAHLNGCDNCRQNLVLEHKIDESLKDNLTVDYKVDLSEKIVHHFTQEKSFFLRIDVKGIMYVLLLFSGLFALTQVASILKGIDIPYLNLICSSVMGLFFVELLLTYIKYKRNSNTI